jgi:hypothetical protein
LVLERRFLRPESLLPLVHAEVLCVPENNVCRSNVYF